MLHQHVCKPDDGVLHTGGQAEFHNSAKASGIYPELFPFETVDRILSCELPEAQQRADRLRNDRGDRSALHAEPEHADEQQIQNDVQHRRHDEIIQGTAAVAHRVHHAFQGVVHHNRHGTEKIDAQIRRRVRQHFFRNLHPAQDLRRHQNAEDRQRAPADQRKHDVRMHRFGNAFEIPRAEIARDHDARAHGCADEKADQQVDEASRRIDRRKRVAAEKVPDDPRVRRVVKLLKQLTQKDRSGKGNQRLPRLSLREKTRRLRPMMQKRHSLHDPTDFFPHKIHDAKHAPHRKHNTLCFLFQQFFAKYKLFSFISKKRLRDRRKIPSVMDSDAIVMI